MKQENVIMNNQQNEKKVPVKNNYIKQLKKEHIGILAHLQEVKKQGVHTMEGRNALMTSKDLLCQHLKNEDEKLYPELKRVAKNDKKLKEMITEFIEEMKEATKFCQAFFEKYSIGGGGIEFLRDFEKLYDLLKNRIQKEETVLFPKYKELETMGTQ